MQFAGRPSDREGALCRLARIRLRTARAAAAPAAAATERPIRGTRTAGARSALKPLRALAGGVVARPKHGRNRFSHHSRMAAYPNLNILCPEPMIRLVRTRSDCGSCHLTPSGPMTSRSSMTRSTRSPPICPCSATRSPSASHRISATISCPIPRGMPGCAGARKRTNG